MLPGCQCLGAEVPRCLGNQLPGRDRAVALKLQKLYRRRLVIGAPAVTAVLVAAGLTSGVLAANAATPPLLTTLTYTATGPGGALRLPAGVSASNGTVYVSDTSANVLAKLGGGTTTAVAGSLTAFGEHGDGGQAVNASLYHPGGTAVDANGDVFVADSGDNVVREITAAGVISRFAGTDFAGLGFAGPFGFPAAFSSLDYAQGVAVDAQGDVFIADTYNNRVVKVTPKGVVFAVAGDGAAGYSGDGRLAAFAELNEPAGVAVDAQGNLYIADSANNVIRRVDAKTGIITTVAGDFAADKADDGLGGVCGDGGAATRRQPPRRPRRVPRRRRPRHQRPAQRPPGRRRRRRRRPVHRRHLQQRHPRGHPRPDHHHRRERRPRGRRPPAPRRREHRQGPHRLEAEHPLRRRDRPEHRHPLHRRHRQQQDRRRHRPRPARRHRRPDRPRPALTAATRRDERHP